jgi:hypothetical protein
MSTSAKLMLWMMGLLVFLVVCFYFALPLLP